MEHALGMQTLECSFPKVICAVTKPRLTLHSHTLVSHSVHHSLSGTDANHCLSALPSFPDGSGDTQCPWVTEQKRKAPTQCSQSPKSNFQHCFVKDSLKSLPKGLHVEAVRKQLKGGGWEVGCGGAGRRPHRPGLAMAQSVPCAGTGLHVCMCLIHSTNIKELLPVRWVLGTRVNMT